VGVRLTIDTKQGIVVSTCFGELTDTEILDHTSRIRSHPDFDPSFSELVDFSEVTATTISTSALRALAGRASIFNPTSLHVVIAPQDHIFGLARMAEVFAEKTKPNVVVVRTLEEARILLRLKKNGRG
jgi:hypothetical protein